VKISYDANLMHFMSVFSSIVGAEPKDCFYDQFNMLTFVVQEHDFGKAIGKQGSKVRMLERALNRKIKIVEFNPDVIRFIKNVVYPLETRSEELRDKTVVLEAADSRNRGLLIGRAAQNLRNFESIVKRYFDIEQLRVM
jgi:transcription termination/antitermination protein NusA